MQGTCQVEVEFHSPPEPLRRYFTSFYLATITPLAGASVTDLLHPEWANLRFFSGSAPISEGQDGSRLAGKYFTATGSSSRSVRFTVGQTRLWGVGLLPLGWAKFVRADAADHANTVVDGNEHAAFASFRPLARSLFGDHPDAEAELGRISAHFLARIAEPVSDEERIVAIHDALIDPEISTVAALVERTGSTPRTVERVCHRAFGFPPKLLLRRQRFMRSLAQFILEPSVKWLEAMDGHYYDQAQFVRDCRQFIGITPSQYAALDKPVLSAIVRERARIAGAPVQTLDRPTGGAPRPEIAGG